MIFTALFLFFMMVMSIQRIWETFFKSFEKEKGTIVSGWTLFSLSSVHFTVGILTALEYFIIKRHINFIITGIGFIFFLFSFVLRKRSMKILGKYHSVHIEIRKNHRLIQNDLYGYMRHPYYLSVITELLAFPLIPNAYYSFCFSLFFYLPLVLIRVYLEEKAMIEKFGEEYLLYKRSVRAFLPLRRLKVN